MHPAHRLVAVDARHHDVHQHHVDAGVVPEHLDPVRAVVGVEDGHAEPLLERRRQGEDVADVVVDDQHARAEQGRVVPTGALQHLPLGRGEPGLFPVEEQGGLLEQALGRGGVLHNDRLGERLERVFFGAGEISGGVDHHRHDGQGRVVADAIEKLVAIHLRQAEVEHDAVEAPGPHGAEGLLGAAGGGDVDVVAAEQLDDAAPLVLVVLHDEQAAAAAADEAHQVVQHRVEVSLRAGLVYVAARPLRQGAVHPLLGDRDDLNRDVTHGRVVLEPVEDRPAVHARQGDVKGDGVGLEVARQGEAGLPTGRHDDLEAAGSGAAHECDGEGGVVVDHQQRDVAGEDRGAVIGDSLPRERRCAAGRRGRPVVAYASAFTFGGRRPGWRRRRRRGAGIAAGACAPVGDHRFLGGGVVAWMSRRHSRRLRHRGTAARSAPRRRLSLRGVVEREKQRERAALSGRAVHPNLPLEQGRDFPADRQAQARPAVLTAGRPVGLLKRLEDHPVLLLRDADPRILHRKRHGHARGIQRVVPPVPAGVAEVDAQLD